MQMLYCRSCLYIMLLFKAHPEPALSGRIILPLGSNLFHSDLHFVAMFQLRQHDPRRYYADNRNTKVEPNTNKVIGVAFGLHSVCQVRNVSFG